MNSESPRVAAEFFDSLTPDYTEAILRCFPRYPEMLWAVLDYLPPQRKLGRVLELGCGTGNLTVLAQQTFPDCELTVVDISEDSIEECCSRFDEKANVDFRTGDFRDLNFEAASFDLIISSIAIHHLEAPEKRKLFAQAFDWLTPGGIFTFADQCAGETEDLTKRHTSNWKSLSETAGSTEAEWQMWMQHQQDCDYHDTLSDQMQWLRDAGFSIVDCTWRYLLWSVVQARKIDG